MNKKTEKTANQESKKVEVKIVKRTKEGLLTVSTLTGNAASKVKALFANDTPLNHIAKATDKITQLSVINQGMLANEGNKVIAEKLIKLRLFPANHDKVYEDDKKLLAACVARVSNHRSYVQGKQARQTVQAIKKTDKGYKLNM